MLTLIRHKQMDENQRDESCSMFSDVTSAEPFLKYEENGKIFIYCLPIGAQEI